MKNLVTVGGGTGSHSVLLGIKTIPGTNISAIVSMADDGATNGMLRKNLEVLPPSDARQCLAALSEEDEIFKKLFDFRFENGELGGYNLGSIIMAAVEKITGSFEKSLEIVSQILKVKGKVIPVTLDQAILCGDMKNGGKIEGESKIKDEFVEKIFYKNPVKLNPLAQEVIQEGDFIIICPGSFYTSIVTNLIVDGFKEALASSKAKIIAVANLGNDYNINEYVERLESYLGRSIDTLLKPDNSLASENNNLHHDPIKLAKKIEKIIND